MLTLEEMTQEVVLNMQGKNVDPVRAKRWIHFGNVNLATHKELEELRVVEVLEIIAGQTEYPKPTDLLGIKTVEVEGKKLVKTGRLLGNPNDAVEGEPKVWFRRGNLIHIWPIPTEAASGYIEYIRLPVRMTERDDVTEFHAGWDLAVIYLATHHGYLAINEQDVADRWLGRALGYIGSRLTEKDIEADTPRGGGVNIAWTLEDIQENPPHYEE